MLEFGLLRIDYAQHLARNPQLKSGNRTFRHFLLSRREHLFKNWPKEIKLNKLKICLSCGVESTVENPITTDHVIPQVLYRSSDPIRQQLQEVITDGKNQMSQCQRCHSQIDQQKIKTLGVEEPQNPSAMFDFLLTYPIPQGANRYPMLRALQITTDRYIQIIENFKDTDSSVDPQTLAPFVESLPNAYVFSGYLYRHIQEHHSELDARLMDQLQYVA